MLDFRVTSKRFGFIVSILLFMMPTIASEIDLAIEETLDRYIQVIQQDQTEASVLLNELAQTDIMQVAIQSRVRLISYLVFDAYYSKDTAKTERLMQQLMQQAQFTEHPDALSEIFATELELLMYQQKLDDAVIKADKLVLQLKDASNTRVSYYANNVLGRLFKADSQYERALEHFIRALDSVSETDDALTLRRRGFLNFNIAQVHTELKNWPQAKALTKQLIADAIKYQHITVLPELYLLQGYIASSEKQFDIAISVNKKGLVAALENNDEYTALTFENNLGATYIELQDYAAAKRILLLALVRAGRLKDEYSQQLITMNLGYIRVFEGEQSAGIEQIKASMSYFSQHATKAEFEPYYEWLAKAYAAAGMYQQQADTLLEQMALREDIRSAGREARLNELQNRYNTKAQAQQITILEQENNLKAQLLENKQLQQKLTLLFVLLMLFAAMALLQLYRKVRRSNRKLYETNKQLAFQSQRDHLTGLYNRRALQEHMQLRSKQRREQDASGNLTGLLLLDIDFFKRINDHYGHSAGDAVLIDISRRLQKTCRENDMVVRWGGEEILLVLENISPSLLDGFIQRILHVIAEPTVKFEQYDIHVTASGGFIHLPFSGIKEEHLDWEKVMQIVDMALYLSKANGRNQVCMIKGLTVSFEQAEALLYSDLTGAIQQGMLDVGTVHGPGGTVS
ncbi:GGDEF domain-containing protein [Rheinheimera baltica]|uniref:tetratricopeptide repeat-containing diguanylate cyclase n=1 Tax=Rheinheimera baltica TaxID=67576 RepID=UPI00273E0E67|nr:GGDEF domain-containing protein [Rheinheimera baltica]MDP5142405.1 GGDEF domain-containing protein [Rheinheimera baltica]